MMLENGVKVLDGVDLISLIGNLKLGAKLCCNQVGNLTIIDPSQDNQSIGFIDFIGDGEICYFNDDDSEGDE